MKEKDILIKDGRKAYEMNKTVFLRICFPATLILGVMLFAAPSDPVAASSAADPSCSSRITTGAEYDKSIKLKIGLSVLGVAGSGFGICMINRSKSNDKTDHRK